MKLALFFFLGLVIGTNLGVFVMCLFSIDKRD